jgi:ribosomal protein S18 acetylase RimI-like enzyme
MDTEVTVRPATLADTSALAVLVDIAADGMAVQMWRTLAAPAQSPVEVGRARARREEGGFSYRNTIVAERDGEIAASLVAYQLDDPYDLTGLDEMPEFVRPLLRLESQAPGSWYVNVLATFPEFRGRGIGAELLEVAESLGRKTGARAMSVIVGSWNEGAMRLYERKGYTPAASERAVLPVDFAHKGDWVLMIKALGEGK